MTLFLCLLGFAASSFVYTYVNAIFKCTKSNGNDYAPALVHHFGARGEGGGGQYYNYYLSFVLGALWGVFVSFRFRFRIIYTIFKQMFLKSLYNLLLLTKMFESIKNVLKKTFFIVYCLIRLLLETLA